MSNATQDMDRETLLRVAEKAFELGDYATASCVTNWIIGIDLQKRAGGALPMKGSSMKTDMDRETVDWERLDRLLREWEQHMQPNGYQYKAMDAQAKFLRAFLPVARKLTERPRSISHWGMFE